MLRSLNFILFLRSEYSCMCVSTQDSLWKFSFYLIIYSKRLNIFQGQRKTTVRRISEHLVSWAVLYYIKKGMKDNWALTLRAGNSWWGAGCLSFYMYFTSQPNPPSQIFISLSLIFYCFKIIFFIYFFKELFFKKDFSYLFLEKGERREKKRERNISVFLNERNNIMHPPLGTWSAIQACALTGIEPMT